METQQHGEVFVLQSLRCKPAATWRGLRAHFGPSVETPPRVVAARCWSVPKAVPISQDHKDPRRIERPKLRGCRSGKSATGDERSQNTATMQRRSALKARSPGQATSF
eukprot:2925842-Amphidinium_carterae.1